MYSEKMCWINPGKLSFESTDALYQLIVPDTMIDEAQERLVRFAPFIEKVFPETAPTRGIIESPLREIPNMQRALQSSCGAELCGRLFLKLDSHLPIAGSVKARGGIYEVLKHAEELALAHGMIAPGDDYTKFATEQLRAFLGGYTVQVGSTGNLGISIGVMSAALGFRVIIHMSADAKQWKKQLLRSRGAEVVEYSSDYSAAVAEGRRLSDADPRSHFVDDEKSVDLFVGYATAARRLQKQLDEQGVAVDGEHPLIVYIPAGVGGAPGGISYGLKRLFGDNVHCFFVETTTCPSVLIGMDTGKFEKARVTDYGISGKTEADGLACASPSGFVTRMMKPLLSGEFTLDDAQLFDYLRMLDETEGLRIEPSSCAAFAGPCGLMSYAASREYLERCGIVGNKLENVTQIAWATGGSMIPEHIYGEYLNTYL